MITPLTKKTKFKKNKKHFTLLELIVSIAVFATIMATIGTGLFSIQRTWEKVTEKNKQLKTYQILDKVFDSAFRNCIRFTWKNENFQEKSLFHGTKTNCIIPYKHRITKISTSGIRFLKIYLNNNRIIAEYKDTPLFYWNNYTNTELSMEVLASDVKSISFLYAYKKNNEITWLDNWPNDILKIPSAIQITVEWKNKDVQRWLRRTAGFGKFESHGEEKTTDKNNKNKDNDTDN